MHYKLTNLDGQHLTLHRFDVQQQFSVRIRNKMARKMSYGIALDCWFS